MKVHCVYKDPDKARISLVSSFAPTLMNPLYPFLTISIPKSHYNIEDNPHTHKERHRLLNRPQNLILNSHPFKHFPKTLNRHAHLSVSPFILYYTQESRYTDDHQTPKHPTLKNISTPSKSYKYTAKRLYTAQYAERSDKDVDCDRERYVIEK